MSSLDLSNVITVTLQGTPTLLGMPNINTVCLFSKETPVSFGGDSYRLYTDPITVGTDWGTSSNAYKIAQAFFAQSPNPLNTNGYLAIVPRASGGTEALPTALARVQDLFAFYGIIIDEEISGSTFTNFATAVQALDKFWFYASSNKADYASGGSGILYNVMSASQSHVRCLYYNDGTSLDTQKFAAAYAARGMSVNFSGSNTAQTMHLKSLAGFVADTTIGQTDLTNAYNGGCDTYPNIAGISSLYTSGKNQFFDEIYNEMWFKLAIQTAGYNYLRATNTKIPQTEPGMEGMKNELRKVCQQAVSNGFAGRGSWTSSSVFGDPEALIRSVKDLGYYVYSLPISQQLTADRVARKAPVVQIAIKTQGAIHSANVIVNVNL